MIFAPSKSLGFHHSGNGELVVASQMGNDIKRDENWMNCGNSMSGRSEWL